MKVGPGRAALVARELALVAVTAATVLALFGWADGWGIDAPLARGAGPRAALVLCAVLAMFARYRFPTLALLAGAGLIAVDPVTGGALAVVAYAAGLAAMPGARRIALLVACVVVPVTATTVLAVGEPRSLVEFRITVVMVTALVCGIVPGLVGVLVGQRERLLAALRERNVSLERAHRAAEEETRLRERSRIAQEMHDLLGHRLSLVTLHAGGLELASAAGDADVHRTSVLVHATARQAMRELRGVLGVLRAGDARADPPEPLTAETGTRPDLLVLVSESRAAGIDVTLAWTGEDLADADPAARRAVHRVVREALANVHHHAPGATVEVLVRRDAREVRVEVRNGPEPAATRTVPGSGLGLVGLRERVRLLGGALRAEPAGGGFTVVALIPLHPQLGPDAGPGRATVAGRDPRLDLGAARRTGALTGAALTLGLVGVIAVQYLTTAFIPYTPEPAAPDSPALGLSHADFVDRFGPNDPLAQVAASGREPARPDGATCDYHLGTSASPDTTVVVDRYCFRADQLLELRELAIAVPAR